jgi:hypothetical protein
MERRYQTWFGVKIPAWKEEKYGSGATTIRFVLTGKIVSKKNNLQAIAVRKPALIYLDNLQKKQGFISISDAKKAINMVRGKVIGNTEYKAFIEKFKPIIQQQSAHWASRLGEKGLIFPLQKSTMTLRLYFKDRYVTDTVNKQQTIQDLLVESGVIVDDDRKSFNPVHSASAEYYNEITQNIAFISLTFKLRRHIPLV